VRPGSPESEVASTDTVSQGISEEENMPLASSCEEAATEANLVPSNLAEGSSSKPAGTAAGVKRKTEAGPTPPQATRKKKKKEKKNKVDLRLGKRLLKLNRVTSLVWY